MTWTITTGVEQAVRAGSSSMLSTTLGVAVIALLVAVLLLRDIRSIARRRGRRESIAVLEVLLAPLIVAFPVLVIVRLVDLLQ